MKEIKLKFQINTDGYLMVSYDNGCTWELIGKVVGNASTVPGPQGEQGEQGPAGADGADGADGDSPYINDDGNWVVEGIDTGIPARGADSEIEVVGSSDIGVVGTPRVTTTTVGNKLVIQFHELKGASGAAPTITAEKIGNEVIFKVDGHEKAKIKDGVQYTAGTHIEITDSNVINCQLVGGNGININNNNEIELILTVPTEKNELIYSDDGETLTTHQLMYTGGLVVDTPEDLALCKLGADVALSEVINWHRFGGSEKADWYEYETRKSVDLTLPEFTFRGETQDYIFNHQNPSNTTGFVSPDEYSDYDVFVSMGILNDKKDVGATDYIGYIAAVKYDSTIPKYWGLSISAHTMNDSDKLNRSGQSTTQHTISVQGWIQANETGSTTTGVSLLSTSDGNLIIPYNSDYNNNDGSHQASSMLCRIKRSGSIINVWFSDPYYTNEEEGDAAHINELHYDRTLTINLANYTVSFIDLNGTSHTTSYASNATVVEIFDKIATSARRGYEQRSNPGSMFRLCNADEMILDVTPGEDKVYKKSNGVWVVQNTTPQLLFQNGSRIAWNRITDKLFYNDGASIYRISASPIVPPIPEVNDGVLSVKAEGTEAARFTANSSTNTELDIVGGMGVSVSKAGTNKIKIDQDSNHTVIALHQIIKAGSGSQHEYLNEYIVRCDLNGTSINVVPFKQFGELALPANNFRWTKDTTGVKYAGILGAVSVSSTGLFKLVLTNASGKVETHYVGFIEDTYHTGGSQGDRTLCFITTCGWNFVFKSAVNSLYCYLEIPSDFIGTVELIPVQGIIAAKNIGCFDNNSGTLRSYGWSSASQTAIDIDLLDSAMFGSPLPEDGTFVTPVGKYNVDIMYNFDEIAVGDKIADTIINDCILHDLSKKVESILNNTALSGSTLTLGTTTINEAQLQALLAMLS